jgi:CubicO group peptidase (beta-lactamase class C family)
MKRLWMLAVVVLFVDSGQMIGAGLPKSQPHEVGVSEERLQRIGQTMDRWVNNEKFAGITVAVARQGRLAYFESFGNQDREAGKAIQADTIVRLASMTKPIVSTAAMIALEEGLLLLDDPVSDFIPGMGAVEVLAAEDGDGSNTVALKTPMTIRHLLTHTSGLSNSKAYRVKNVFRNATLAQMAKKLPTVPLAHQPGEKWRYGRSIDVLGRVIEVVSGLTLDRFLEEKIFRPLGMKDTTYWVPEEELARLAVTYQLTDGGRLEVRQGSRLGASGRGRAFPRGSAGLYSTAGDYLRFCQMLLNGGELDGVRLLSPHTVELMMMNHVAEDVLPPDGPNRRKGYGFGLGGAILVDVARSEQVGSEGEFTWGGARGTYFWIDPEEQLVGLFLVQRRPPHYKDRERKQFKTLVYQALVE